MSGWWGQGGKKIKWKNTAECFCNIGAWNGEEILPIYLVSTSIDLWDITQSSFFICDDNRIMLNPVGTYEFEMELNGKLNGQSIKPIPFRGTFEVIVRKSDYSINVSGLVMKELIK